MSIKSFDEGAEKLISISENLGLNTSVLRGPYVPTTYNIYSFPCRVKKLPQHALSSFFFPLHNKKWITVNHGKYHQLSHRQETMLASICAD